MIARVWEKERRGYGDRAGTDAGHLCMTYAVSPSFRLALFRHHAGLRQPLTKALSKGQELSTRGMGASHSLEDARLSRMYTRPEGHGPVWSRVVTVVGE